MGKEINQTKGKIGMKTALLLIDIQNDYFPGGNMELTGAIVASIQAQKMLSYARSKALSIFHIQHIATRSNATFFLPKTNGVQIHDNVKPLESESVIIKHYPNSFRETELLSQLQQQAIETLLAAGMMTHMCVDSTVRAAFDLGFTINLLQDACATRDLVFNERRIAASSVQQAFLAALSTSFAQLVSVSDYKK